MKRREFPTETIPLSEELTNLFSRKDPRKIEEAQKLQHLVTQFDPGALFHRNSFLFPVKEARRTAEFGDTRKYVFVGGHIEYGVHKGIDFGLVQGTPVYACASGRVVMSSPRIMTGNTIVIEHLPGVYSMYFHLHTLIAQDGYRVRVGEEIGTVGSTGLSTAAHLHWEIRVNGVAVDPEAFTDGGAIDMDRLSGVYLR